MQQYQSSDGSYISEVNADLQVTGGVLVSDPGPEVFMVPIALWNSSDAMSYRGLQGGDMVNLQT